MPDREYERVFELGLSKQADKVRVLLAVFLLVLVLAAPDNLVSNPATALSAVALIALLTVWTMFFLDWEAVWAKGRLPLVAVTILLVDVGVLALFIHGTRGFHSPFTSLLFLPILFAAVFFGSLSIALPLVTGIIAAVHVCFAAAVLLEPGILGQLLARLIGVIAIAWLSYGLSRISERERQANDSVVRNLVEGVLLVHEGEGQTIVLANPQIEKLCGLPTEMILGQRLGTIPDEPAYERLLAVVADVGGPGVDAAPVNRDITLHTPDAMDLRVITIPCGGTEKRPLGWVVVCQDVTDIRAVARMKEEGMAILSHEVCSPLATLRMVSQLLATLADELDEEERARAIWAIDKESERLVALAGKLLDVSAQDHGAYDLELEQVQVAELIDKIGRIFQLKAPDRGILMLSECEEELPEIRADAVRLEQVLTNLCDNAFKYSPEGGTVKLAAARRNDHIEISVTDTGCGIAPDKIKAIFDKFTQADADSALPIVERGVGLGLYIARTIVQAHGGHISVDSAVGEGSTFRVCLPIS